MSPLKCRNGSSCTFTACSFVHPRGFIAMCKDDGRCKYGDKCRYRHLKKQISPDQIPLCRNDGHCRFGLLCKFRHIKNNEPCDHHYVKCTEKSNYKECSKCNATKYCPETKPSSSSLPSSYFKYDIPELNHSWGSYKRSPAEQLLHDRCEAFYNWGCP